MEINVSIDNDIQEHPDSRWLRGVARRVLVEENAGPGAEVGLLITGQDRIHELNRIYRGKDKPTDVLSFGMQGDGVFPFVEPPDEALHLGEVIISYPQAVIQAQEGGHPVRKEVAILIIHGVLHLLGYDHEKAGERRKMQAREKAILGQIDTGD